MRSHGLLGGAFLALTLVPGVAGVAAASPSSSGHPLLDLVERERQGVLSSRMRLEDATTAGGSTLDCVHSAHDIRLDPASGVTTASLDLTVAAKGGPLSRVAFSFDLGLALGDVSADGRAVAVEDVADAPERTVTVTFSPALAPGEQTTLHVAYAGTLACGSYPSSGAVLCTKGDDFSYFSHPSLFPFIFDPATTTDATLDAMTRDITLRVPNGVDVVVTGERVSDTTGSNGDHVSTWTIDHPLSRVLGLYVFAGKLGETVIGGRSVPTTLVYPAPGDAVDDRLASWSSGVLDWVESMSGGPLPFARSLSLVRLPADLGDPGTATFGMTLLSDTYVRAGDLMHEETWAHENTHLFWGIVVPETNPAESRLMSEGMAVLSELDYTYAHHFADQDRDAYLARRFVPIRVDLEQQGKDLPPVELAPGQPLPDAFRTTLYTLWAYYKTSAALDHLRATIGDDAFQKATSAYVAKCSYVGCRPEDFRDVLTQTTGRDMSVFFDRWITQSSRPRVTIGLSPSGSESGGAEVLFSKDDDLPMTLEVWLIGEDGGRTKQRVDLDGRTTALHVDAPSGSGGVRSVMASPRHDVLVDVEPAVDGDLDFDGEVDGFDILRCSRLVGTAYQSEVGALGLWNVDEEYDPRCDRNGDLRIDDADIADVAKSFGTLRSSK